MREYIVDLPTGEATIQLPDDEAEKRGLKPAVTKQRQPANKEAQPADKTPEKPTAAERRAAVAARSFGQVKPRKR